MLSPEKKRWLVLIAFFMLAVVILVIFFSLNYTRVCDNEKCFSDSLASCKRAEFLKESGDASWYYKINGLSAGDKCEVYVKLAQIKRGEIEILRLEGKDMTCFLPYSVVESPQSDVEQCHGELREEIQSILIQKMHSYLLENIGQVSNEFTTVI